MANECCRSIFGRLSVCKRLSLFACAFAHIFAVDVPPLEARTPEAASATNICNTAAHQASLSTGIPEGILLAVSVTETGRKRGKTLRAWPWTVNMQGKGYWFDSRAKALAFAKEHFKSGARSFDVGCFQINYKWHGHAFASISAMFDPNTNAVYAAKYLLALYNEKGNWLDAVGAYHSRTPKFAKKYTARFAKIHASLTGKKSFSAPFRAAANAPLNALASNRYPLLQPVSGATRTSGSIVLLSSTGEGTALISGPSGRLF